MNEKRNFLSVEVIADGIFERKFIPAQEAQVFHKKPPFAISANRMPLKEISEILSIFWDLLARPKNRIYVELCVVT